MKPKLTITQNNGVLSGTLTLKHHVESLLLVRKVYDEKISTLLIDMPEELDLTFLQMLWSLRMTAKASGNTLSIQLKLKDTDARLLCRYGFSSLLTPSV